jgi:hypothetical protein
MSETKSIELTEDELVAMIFAMNDLSMKLTRDSRTYEGCSYDGNTMTHNQLSIIVDNLKHRINVSFIELHERGGEQP